MYLFINTSSILHDTGKTSVKADYSLTGQFCHAIRTSSQDRTCVTCRDVNKATSHKAKDFHHSPRPGKAHSATVLDQNKAGDIIYLL